MGELRKGLKDRVATINGLHPYATMPAEPRTPSAVVIPRSKELQTFDGGGLYRFAIWVYVANQDINRAQTQIDEFLSADGPNSIEAAIDEDPSLGGVAESASVTGWADYASVIKIGDADVLGVRIDVEVMA